MNPWDAYKQEREAQGKSATLGWKTETAPTAKTAKTAVNTNASNKQNTQVKPVDTSRPAASNPWDAYKQERASQGKTAVPAWTAAAKPTASTKGISPELASKTMLNPLTGKRMPALTTSKDANDKTGFRARQIQQTAQPAERVIAQYEGAEKAYREGRNAEAVSKELEELKSRRDKFEKDYASVQDQRFNIQEFGTGDYKEQDAEMERYDARLKKMNEQLGVFDEKITSLQQELQWAEMFTLRDMITSATRAADFKEKSKPQDIRPDPNGADREAIKHHTLINQPEIANGIYSSGEEFSHMTDEEKNIYNYIFNTQGEETAENYLSYLNDTLMQREGTAVAERMDYPVLRELYATGAGVEGWFKNVGQLMTRDVRENNATDYAMAELMSDAGPLSRVSMSAAQSVGNQLPSMVIGSVAGPVGGAISIGAGAAGGAYTSARNEGMSEDAAKKYALMIGASEATLQYFLGGIAAFGGISGGALSTKIGQMVSKLGNVYARTAIRYAGNVGSEIFEEVTQEYLDPLFRTIATGEKYDAPTFEALLEVAASTAISTLALGAAGGDIKSTHQKEQVRELAKAAMNAPKDSDIYKVGKELNDKLDSEDGVTGEEVLDEIKRMGMSEDTKVSQAIKATKNSIEETRKAEAMAQAPAATAQAQTAARADAVQQTNPDATVIRSASVQAYIDTKTATLQVAQEAGAVLDKALSGEAVTDSEIDKLKLTNAFGAKAVSAVLGVPVQKATTKAAARAAFRDALAQYEQSAVATATAEAQRRQEEAVATFQPENELPAEANTAPLSGSAEMTQPAIRDDILSWNEMDDAKEGAVNYAEFAKQYRAGNKKAKVNDIVVAYDDYLQSFRSNFDGPGVRRDEYSARVEAGTVDAIDSLAKLLNLRVRFADLGGDNGTYENGVVTLDIAPTHEKASDAFLFSAAHEIAHGVKEKSAEAWRALEDYAVKIKGGKKAIQAKRSESAVYNTDALAREELTCDFIGEVLSDQETLDTFTEALRSGAFSTEHANIIVRVFRSTIGKLFGKGRKAGAATDALVQRVKALYGANLETAENAVREMQKAVSAAVNAEKNTTDEGGTSKTSAKLNIDNAEKSSYNGSKSENGGVLNEGTTDGNRVDRGVAEGIPLRQISDRTEASERHGENGRGNQEFPRKHLSQSLDSAFKTSGVVATELYDYSGDSAAYSYALDAARNADKDNGWCVTPQSAEELAGKKLRMDSKGSIGYVLADGDIEGVFKNPKTNTTRRALSGVIPQAISEGGIKLDCYGDGLVAVYEAYGFVPVARVEFNPEYANPGWDESKGRPFIYMMMHNGDSAETVVRNIGQYGHLSMEQLNALPTYNKDGYDDAAAYRDSLFKNPDKRYSKKIIPSKAEADALAEQRAQAAEIAEQERIRKRDDLMRKIVASAPENAKKSAKDVLNQKAAENGAIPAGESPVRESNIPVSMDGGETKVRSAVRTAYEAEITPDELLPEIDEAITKNLFNYKPEKNKEQMDRARTWLRDRDIDEAAQDWFRDTAAGKLSTDISARGILLYNQYATAAKNAKDAAERKRLEQTAVRILVDISNMATIGGQIGQMTRLIKKLSPEMQFYALERNIKLLEEQVQQQFGATKKGKTVEIKINKDIARKWVSAMRRGDTAYADILRAQLYQDIAQQVPKTFPDRWNAWRYLSMLGNPKTIIRNTFGNVGFMPAKAAKDKIGAIAEVVGEKLLKKIDKEQRTKYFGVLTASEAGRALLKHAKSDFTEVQDMLDGVGKYQDGNVKGELAKAIAEVHRTFTAPVLKQWQQATTWAMDNEYFGDHGFMRLHYMSAFAQAAAARGYTAEMFQNGSISQEQLDSLREYAVRQAKKATYRDANAVSNFIKKLRFKGDNKVAKIANVAIEGILPFKATPANVLVRGFEYSPLGLLKAISTDIYAVKTGKIDAAEYVERLSSGLTGAALFGVGMLMASLGLIRVNADEDDERVGRQGYSLEIGDFSITLDWIAPASIPFFMGAQVQEIVNNEYEGVTLLSALADATSDAFAPMLEMSMLSSVQDLLDTMTYSYGDGADFSQIVTAFFVQPFFNYVSQAFPTILSQTASTLESNRGYTYTGDIQGKVEKSFVRNIARITEKIPFVDLWQADYVDEWGRTEDNGNIFKRFFNNFLNPAYTSTINITDADAEIGRLEEATGENVAPTRRGYTITISEEIDGKRVSTPVRLTAEQYERYSKEYGQQAALMMASLMSSDYYDTLSDEAKVKALDDILGIADKYGKLAADVGYEVRSDEDDRKLFELITAGVPAAEAYAAKLYYTQLRDDENLSGQDKYERFRVWVSKQNGWTRAQKNAAIQAYGKFSSGYVVKSESFDEMVSSGKLDENTANEINEAVRALAPEGDSETVSLSQKLEAISNISHLSEAEVDAALRAYMDDDATAKYERWMQSGISSREYVDINEAIRKLEPRDGNKSVAEVQKVQVIANYAGLSDDEKYALLAAFYNGDDDAKRRAKIASAQSAGIPAATYVNVWSDISGLKSDKDKNGKTITNSLKNKVAKYLRNVRGLTDAQKNLIWREYYESGRADGWKYAY